MRGPGAVEKPDRRSGCRMLPDPRIERLSFEAEEAAIAEAVSGINPLDQGMGRELAIPSAGVRTGPTV